jgi:dTDP-4-amino-4,6-dideoxygalactose transaminase
MDEIMAIAKKHGLLVIEDACQAFGASYKGRPVAASGMPPVFHFSRQKT